jgi:hypothetical protein
MNLIEQSKQWRDEATEIIEASRIKELLGQFGEVTPTGSYEYDLMLGADIDFFVCNENPTRELAEDILVTLTKSGYWNSQMFCDWMTLPDFRQDLYPELPLGHYFCFKRDYKGNRWKVDIFFVDSKELTRRLKPKPNYSEKQKKLILSLKDYRNKGEFAADLSSQIFYDAVLKNNIQSIEEFTNFIKNETK